MVGMLYFYLLILKLLIMPNVIVSRGEAATLAQIKQAAIDQLGLSPEQVAEVEAISTKAAIKQWAHDNGHDITDEVAPVNAASNSNTDTIELKQGGQTFNYKIAPVRTETGQDTRIIGVLDNLQVVQSRQTAMRPALQFDITKADGENESVTVHPAVALAFFASQGSKDAASALESYQAGEGNEYETAASTAMEKEMKTYQVPDNLVVSFSGTARYANKTAWFLPLAEADSSTPEEVAAEYGINLGLVVKNQVLEIKPNRTTDNLTNPKIGEKYHGVMVYNTRTGFNIRSVKKSSVTAFQIARETAKAKEAKSLEMQSLIAAAEVLKSSKADINLLGQTSAILSGNFSALLKTQETEA